MSASPKVQSPTNEDPAARRQRLREQMKAFYGAAAGTTTTTTTASASAPFPGAAGTALGERQAATPAMDMDSEFFNVQQYTTHLLQNESLQGLVEADTRLLRSVRQLDRELQELVYRNYSKFISATDTIRHMHDQVSTMDERLSNLDAHVATVGSTSQQLLQALEPHRVQVEESITTNRKLKKAAFMSQLPRAMDELLRKGQYTECVQYWVMGDSFFQKHLAGTTNPEVRDALTPLQSACWDVVRRLYKKMETDMAQIPLEDPAAMDSIHRLVESLRLLRATSVFHSSEGVVEGEESDVSFEESVRRVLMRSVQANFVKDIAAVELSLREVFYHPAAGGREGSSEPQQSGNKESDSPDATACCELPLLVSALSALPLPQRHLPLEQLPIRDPLAHLKSACALLASNSKRIHDLLMLHGSGAEDGKRVSEEAAIHVAEHIQPVLTDLLAPVEKYFSSLLYTYVKVLFIPSPTTSGTAAQDLLFLVHQPALVREMMEHFASSLVRQLKQISVTLKTLGENYLNTEQRQYQSQGYAALVDQSILNVLTSLSTTLRSLNYAHLPMSPSAGNSAGVSVTSLLAIPSPKCDAASSRGTAILGSAAGGIPTDKSVGESRMLSAASVSSIATAAVVFHFILSRFALASLVSCVQQQLVGVLEHPSEPPSSVSPTAAAFLSDTGRVKAMTEQMNLAVFELLHRTIVLEGQYCVRRLLPPILGLEETTDQAATPDYFMHRFSQPGATARGLGAGGEAAAFLPSAQQLHPAVTSVAVMEWTLLFRCLQQLPPLHITLPVAGSSSYRPLGAGSTLGHDKGNASLVSGSRAAAGHGSSAGGSTGGGSGYSRASPSLNLPTHLSSARVSGSPNFMAMQHAEAPPTHRHGGGRAPSQDLVVAYQRKTQTSLQHNIDVIFVQQSSLYETRPVDGQPATVLKSIVLYVLRALVDEMRRYPKQHTGDVFSFQAVQLHCTFLLEMLLDPPPPVSHTQRRSDAAVPLSTREWASAARWGEASVKSLRHEIEELCMCAYERAADPVVPLSQQQMEQSIRDGLDTYALEMARVCQSMGEGGVVSSKERTEDTDEPQAVPPS